MQFPFHLTALLARIAVASAFVTPPIKFRGLSFGKPNSHPYNRCFASIRDVWVQPCQAPDPLKRQDYGGASVGLPFQVNCNTEKTTVEGLKRLARPDFRKRFDRVRIGDIRVAYTPKDRVAMKETAVPIVPLPSLAIAELLAEGHGATADDPILMYPYPKQPSNVRVNASHVTAVKTKDVSDKIIESRESNVYSSFFKECDFALPDKKKEDLNYLIISSPTATFQHEYFGLDISEQVKRIFENSEICGALVGRSKRVFAMTAGMGRGKTRTLVEIGRQINAYDDAICVPITFNCHWDKIYLPFGNNMELNYAFAIVSRIISVYYRQSFRGVTNSLMQHFQSGNVPTLEPETLIQDCIRHIVKQARQSGQPIKHFVLLVDESARIEAPDKCGKDANSIVRGACLQEQLFPDNELDVNLVLSTLKVNAAGASDSNRPVQAIELPERIDLMDIVKKWIPKYINDFNYDNLDEQSKDALLLTLATLYRIPRLIEYFTHSLKTMKSSGKLRGSDVGNLLSEVFRTFERNYGRQIVFSAPEAKALLFSKDIQVTGNVSDLLISSVFVNSVKRYGETTSIIPESSLISMRLVTTYCKEAFCEVIGNVIEQIHKKMENYQYDKANLGDDLEVMMKALTNARLIVLTDSSINEQNKIVDIKSLLLLKCSYDMGIPQLFEKVKVTGTQFSSCKVPDSNSKIAGFVEAVNSDGLTLNSKFPFIEIKSDKAERFDGAWLLRTENDESFALIIDCKSSKTLIEDLVETKSDNVNHNHGTGVVDIGHKRARQANSFININVAEVKKLGKKIKNNSFADALANGRYVYVYLSTHPSFQTHKVTGTDNVLWMGSDDSYKFLSFFADFHRCSRNLVEQHMHEKELAQKSKKTTAANNETLTGRG